ncbi:hypothetical protein BRADI_4g25155v3 [Brachypodium distachyon]|uniref:Uncharacterized protein n=1 Tax=Brachypodium distachyon TaxID=15368 RepID=A0A2K2CQ37_BRADI|nr:hypothetical protein BRADI_4g25155v3 [Brachypodium distachyon]
MSNIVNDNGGSGNGRGEHNGGRQVVPPLQLNLGPMVAAPPAVAVEEGEGSDMILYQCNSCPRLCMLERGELARCLHCNQLSLFIRNA